MKRGITRENGPMGILFLSLFLFPLQYKLLNVAFSTRICGQEGRTFGIHSSVPSTSFPSYEIFRRITFLNFCVV